MHKVPIQDIRSLAGTELDAGKPGKVIQIIIRPAGLRYYVIMLIALIKEIDLIQQPPGKTSPRKITGICSVLFIDSSDSGYSHPEVLSSGVQRVHPDKIVR